MAATEKMGHRISNEYLKQWQSSVTSHIGQVVFYGAFPSLTQGNQGCPPFLPLAGLPAHYPTLPYLSSPRTLGQSPEEAHFDPPPPPHYPHYSLSLHQGWRRSPARASTPGDSYPSKVLADHNVHEWDLGQEPFKEGSAVRWV